MATKCFRCVRDRAKSLDAWWHGALGATPPRIQGLAAIARPKRSAGARPNPFHGSHVYVALDFIFVFQ
ncbi:MAG: hypothetical protein MUF42_09710 [Cytophagaceae bacterium]|nr:hypothetical protein [Cytophagaceae bacterium]